VESGKKYTVIETDQKYEKLKSSIEDYKDKIQLYNKEKEFDFNKIDDAIKEMQKKINLNKLELRNKEQDVNQAFIKMESIRVKIDADRFNKDDIFYDIKNAEMKIAESNIKISQIKEMTKEKFGNDFKLKIIKDYSVSTMTYNVEKIKRSIEAIGPINWAVSDEYDEQSKRLKVLKDQRFDLLEAEKNLKDAIKKIDLVAKKQFLETFEKIKNNFDEMFKVFFVGGKGSVSLENIDDPLNSNVVIFAQPPGKKNSSLRMLSAGEKSLTAIALLFSIYQYKPSPFCILDEIDAPLDDINIKKFTDVISEYSKSTQFIMVTHNKLTMESADCIYGVTAEKKGISKVISINFTEK
jgi:chromosome segregation protein